MLYGQSNIGAYLKGAIKVLVQQHFVKIIVLGLSTLPLELQAEEKTSLAANYYAELGVGIEHDSVVSVEELDISSNESDSALKLNATVGVKKPLTESTEIDLNYKFNETNYQEFSETDLKTHILGADLSSDVGKARAGLSTLYIESRLDNKDLLTLYRVSPNISGFISKQWFARVAYIYSDKTIETNSDRNAKAHAGEIDFYYFPNGPSNYINFGYRYKDENADTSPFDYDSHRIKLRYVKRFKVFSKTTKLELAWRFEDRDYNSITPSIGTKRNEHRNRWKIEYELPIIKDGTLGFYYGYYDYDSNLSSTDYTQNLVGAEFTYRWE